MNPRMTLVPNRFLTKFSDPEFVNEFNEHSLVVQTRDVKNPYTKYFNPLKQGREKFEFSNEQSPYRNNGR